MLSLEVTAMTLAIF